MTEKEAISRIKDHMEIHRLKEPRAIYITVALSMAIAALKEVQQYREIGTVEELREAVEKQKLKKPVKDKYNHNCCPNCGWIVSGEGGYGEEFCPHCENCGQAIRWENLGEMEDERD